mmetsp:Transcript_103355/g.331414  ORF Transcript_103355/g.331414 Transcript_103355/m.331414 type:complete len:524 (-) Transcript_103355:1892-3463(-)
MLEVTMVVVLSTDLVLAVADGGGAREPGDCHLLPAILLRSVLDDLKLLRSRQSLILGIDLALGLVGRIQLTSEQAVPLETLEERVRLELGVAFCARAQALGSISLQQAPDEALRCLVVEHLRELQLRLPDLFVDLVLAAGVRGVRDVVAEGELPGHEVVDTDTEAPEVRHRRVAFAQQRFRRHIVHGAPLLEELAVDDALGDAEVDDLQVAVNVDEAVLPLEVQIGNAPLMQELQGQDYGTSVELSLRLPQQVQLLQGVQQLAARHQLHEEVDVLLGLEGSDELDDERVVQLSQDAPLCQQGSRLLQHHGLSDAHALQRVAGVRLLRMHHLHDAEPATANDPTAVQRLDFDLSVLEGDTLLHVVQDWACNTADEGLAADSPEFRIRDGVHGRAAGLGEEQSALADVVAHAQRAHLAAVDLDLHQAGMDDVELLGWVALRKDGLARLGDLGFQGVGELAQLLVGERPEDEYLPQRADLVVVQHGDLHGGGPPRIAPIRRLRLNRLAGGEQRVLPPEHGERQERV